MIIIVAMAACLCCICVAVGIYFATNDSSPAPAPVATTTGTPATTSPAPAPSALQTLLSSATALKVAETDLGTAKINPDNQPSFTLTSTPSFSVSGWINAPTTIPTNNWLTVFGGNGFYMSYGSTPMTLACQQSNGPKVASGPQPSNWINAETTPLGTYHHVVVVVNGATANTYVDGQLKQSNWYAYDNPIKTTNWIDSPIAMSFNQYNKPMSGIKVKKFYWFNTPLAAADVATLYADTSSGTTSTYMPEPFDDSKDVADY